MKEKKRPIIDNYEHFSLWNSASATECTGLVTHFSTEDELENYMQIYNYQAIPTKDKNETQDK